MVAQSYPGSEHLEGEGGWLRTHPGAREWYKGVERGTTGQGAEGAEGWRTQEALSPATFLGGGAQTGALR